MVKAKRLKLASVIVLGFLSLAGIHFGYLQLSGNFHEVVPGELYRSAQITPQRLVEYQKAVGIRTVVNLRGENIGAGWYDEEIAAARALGIGHRDFGMSAGQRFPKERAAELIDLLRSAPKPVLIHCKGGADRSGLVAALYLAAIADAGEAAAEGQLSLRFGHVGIPVLSAAYAMDESWEGLEPLFGFNGS